MGSISRTRRC